MKKIWFKIRIQYARLRQWYLQKRKKADDDNIYPMW
jgi:hypothetical protein